MPAPVSQRLRDLIEEGADTDTLHNELLELERSLELPLTEPSEWGTMTPDEIAAFTQHERNAS